MGTCYLHGQSLRLPNCWARPGQSLPAQLTSVVEMGMLATDKTQFIKQTCQQIQMNHDGSQEVIFGYEEQPMMTRKSLKRERERETK